MYLKGVPLTWLPNRTCEEINRYFRDGRGSMRSSAVDMVGVAYRQLDREGRSTALDDNILKNNFADVEYTLSGARGFGPPSFGVVQELEEEYLSGLTNESYLTMNIYQMHQESRGYVSLNSSSMLDPPYVFFNYFSEGSDLDTIAEGARQFIEMVGLPPFASLGMEVYDKPFPKCREYEIFSTDYLRCLVQYTTHANHHHAGTAKMGCNREKDPDAVVDGRCRVYDVSGLRVADPSISHQIPQGHAMAYAYLTGARCGDFIVDDYR